MVAIFGALQLLVGAFHKSHLRQSGSKFAACRACLPVTVLKVLNSETVIEWYFTFCAGLGGLVLDNWPRLQCTVTGGIFIQLFNLFNGALLIRLGVHLYVSKLWTSKTFCLRNIKPTWVSPEYFLRVRATLNVLWCLALIVTSVLDVIVFVCSSIVTIYLYVFDNDAITTECGCFTYYFAFLFPVLVGVIIVISIIAVVIYFTYLCLKELYMDAKNEERTILKLP